MSAHDRVEQMIAAFSLGSLDDAERDQAQREILDHTTGCAECRTLYADLRETAADLALSASARLVPAALEQRILERIRGVSPAAASPAGRTISLRLGAVAAAITLVLVGGLAAFAASIAGRVDRAEQHSALMARALSVVGQPDAKRMMLSGSMPGTLMIAYRPDGEAVLVGSHVAAPDPGMTFELWAMHGDEHAPAGVFRPDDGVVVLAISMSMSMGDVDAFAVTQEPGRMDAPTGKTLWSASM